MERQTSVSHHVSSPVYHWWFVPAKERGARGPVMSSLVSPFWVGYPVEENIFHFAHGHGANIRLLTPLNNDGFVIINISELLMPHL